MTRGGKKYSVTIDDRTLAAQVVTGADDRVEVQLEGRAAPLEVQLLADGERPVALVNGRVVELFREVDGTLRATGTRNVLSVEPAAAAQRGRRSAADETGPLSLRSPMPGRIVKVVAAVGDSVEAGTPLVVIEAMKMENELAAPRAGSVTRILVAAGDAVERDALLIEIG